MDQPTMEIPPSDRPQIRSDVSKGSKANIQPPPATPAPTPAPPTPPAPPGSWKLDGEGCCNNMMQISATNKVFDQKPNGACRDECQKHNASLAVEFPGGAWCTCLGNGFNVKDCAGLPSGLCKVAGCCGSTGVGVQMYEWVAG